MNQIRSFIKPHLLIVDDDKRLRDLLSHYLDEADFFITVSANTKEADEMMEVFLYDAVILDIMMPGENGLDFTKRIRSKSTVPILMLTAMGETTHRINGFECGVDDYLAKPFEPKELLLRIRSLLKRSFQEKPKKYDVHFGPFLFNLQRQVLFKKGESVLLTDVESTLLKIFIENSGKTLSREDIVALLPIEILPRAIDVQVTRLRRKIEDDPRFSRFLQTIRNKGYVFWREA